MSWSAAEEYLAVVALRIARKEPQATPLPQIDENEPPSRRFFASRNSRTVGLSWPGSAPAALRKSSTSVETHLIKKCQSPTWPAQFASIVTTRRSASTACDGVAAATAGGDRAPSSSSPACGTAAAHGRPSTEKHPRCETTETARPRTITPASSSLSCGGQRTLAASVVVARTSNLMLNSRAPTRSRSRRGRRRGSRAASWNR